MWGYGWGLGDLFHTGGGRCYGPTLHQNYHWSHYYSMICFDQVLVPSQELPPMKYYLHILVSICECWLSYYIGEIS